eukprot:6202137-Pleurochrysis_carterae.AAC.1
MHALDEHRVDCDGGNELELPLDLVAAASPLELLVSRDVTHSIGRHQVVQIVADALEQLEIARKQLRRQACLGLLASEGLLEKLLADTT